MSAVYVLDNGYGGSNPAVTGDRADFASHGTMMCDIVHTFNPKANIHSVKMPVSGSLNDIADTFAQVAHRTKAGDVILIGWITNRNSMLDEVAEITLKDCDVVIPAGNYAKPIEEYSPLLPQFHIVEAFNHHNIRMSGSNYGDNTVWMYGVPIQHLGITQRGTSVAAAIYAGLLSRNNSAKFMRRARKTVENIFK